MDQFIEDVSSYCVEGVCLHFKNHKHGVHPQMYKYHKLLFATEIVFCNNPKYKSEIPKAF